MRPGELEYLSKYIQKKYPMYYNLDGFLGFVGDIGTDKKFRSEIELRRGDKSVVEFLNSGDMDSIIDELVDTYAQIKYTKIWANLDSLSSRIKNVISKSSQRDANINVLNDELLDRICREIALGIIKNSQDDDYTIYFNGSFDKKYLEDYTYYFNEYKQEVYKRVQAVVGNKMENSKFKFSEDTYFVILSGLADQVISTYRYEDIVNGLCDKKILSLFNVYRKEIKDEISSYVEKYITNEIENLMGVSVEDIKNVILHLTFVTGEVSADKLLNGECNNLINSCVARYRKNMPNRDESIKHIYGILFAEMIELLNESELLELSNKIYDELREENIFDNDIISGEYDDKIKFLYENERRKNNSVKNGKDPDKRKANKKKRKTYKSIIALILAGSITVAAGKLIIDGVTYIWNLGAKISQDLSNRKPLKKVEEFDNYRYNYIFTKYTDAYVSTLNNVISFYEKTSDYEDQEYKYLGFYRMYSYVMDDKLAIMDSALSELKIKCSLDGTLDNYSCYLDFVYDRLVSMGCDEIKDSKYQVAINVYKNAKSATTGSDLTPMDILILDFPEQATSIEEMMELYGKYSEEKMVSFGNELINSDAKTQQEGGKAK